MGLDFEERGGFEVLAILDSLEDGFADGLSVERADEEVLAGGRVGDEEGARVGEVPGLVCGGGELEPFGEVDVVVDGAFVEVEGCGEFVGGLMVGEGFEELAEGVV